MRTLNFGTREAAQRSARDLKPLFGRMVVGKIVSPPLSLSVSYIVGKINRIRIESHVCHVTIRGKECPIDVDLHCEKIVAIRPFTELKKERKESPLAPMRFFALPCGGKYVVVQAVDGIEAAYLLYEKKGIKGVSFSEIWDCCPKIEHISR